MFLGLFFAFTTSLCTCGLARFNPVNYLNPPMKTVEVVAAVIQHKQQILCVQRGPNKRPYIHEKWEFPGGKVEAGESPVTALAREIDEELCCQIEVGELLLTVDHAYPDFRIIMHAYRCTAPDREVTLTEHIDLRWLASKELGQLDWAAADVPVVEALTKGAVWSHSVFPDP